MPSGKLGTADLAANADTLLYTVPDGKVTTASVRLCNRGTGDARIRIAVGAGEDPSHADYIEYDAKVPANGILEDTGIAMSAGEKLWVRSDTATVSARAHGFEEAE